MAISMKLSDNSPENKRRMVAASGGIESSPNSKSNTHKYTSSQTALMPVTKNAQFAGSGANVVWTQPMFFSPLHTPQNWQVPSKRREMGQWSFIEPCFITLYEDFSLVPVSKFVGDTKNKNNMYIQRGDGEKSFVDMSTKRYVKKKANNIKVLGIPENLFLTNDHNCMVIKKSEVDCIKSFNNKKCILDKYASTCKRLKCNDCFDKEYNISKEKANTIMKGDYFLIPFNTEVKDSIIKNKEQARFAGHLASDGSVSPSCHNVEIVMNINEIDYVYPSLEKTFSNLNCGCELKQIQKKLFRVRTSNNEIYNFASKIVTGKGKNKKFTKEVVFLNTELQKHVIGAYIQSDGSFNKINKNIEITTYSSNLANQLLMMLFRCGILAGANKQKISLSKKTFRSNNTHRYIISIPSSECEKIREYVPGKIKEEYELKEQRGLSRFFYKNYVVSPVVYNKEFDYEGYVYDIREPKTNTVVANNISIYQCRFYYSNEAKVAAGVDFYCFEPNSQVLMANGEQKSISSIVEGDAVRSHDGSVGVVGKVHKRKTKEKMLSIKSEGLDASPLKTTFGHKIFIQTGNGERRFLKAEEIKVGDYSLTPHGYNEKTDCYESNGHEKFILRKINLIEEYDYDGYVYDLTIEGTHSYVANGVSVSNSNFSMNGYKLECRNKKVLRFYEKLVKKLKLSEKLNSISHEYFLLGDVFPFLEISCPNCKGSGYINGKPCNHPDGAFKSIKLMNPDYIEVKDNPIASAPEYYLVPDEELKMIVQRKEPKSIYAQLPMDLIKLISAGQPIPLSSRSISHIKHNASDYGTYGTPMLQRLFTILAYKTKIMTANWIVAERLILPIRIVKVGDKDRPASESDIADVVTQLSAVANDPNLTVVTHHAFEYEWIGACYSEDTEVLTEDGWKLFKDLNRDEEVGTYNVGSGYLEYQRPTEYYEYDFKSNKDIKMIGFKHKNYDCLVTPNHRMLVERDKKIKIVQAREVKHDDKFFNNVKWDGNIPLHLPYKKHFINDIDLNTFLKLSGYYISEGHIKYEKTKEKIGEEKCVTACGVAQSLNSDYYEEIKDVITKTYPNYQIYHDKRRPDNTYAYFTINNCKIARYFYKEFGKGTSNKRIPKWIKNLPVDELRIFFDALMNGDGDTILSKNGNAKYRYSTTSKQLADDVSEICFKLGYLNCIKLEKARKKEHSDIYGIYFTEKRRTTKINIRKRNIIQKDYDGKVYCVSVPNTFLITRRNGHISIQGNSGKIHNITQELEYIGKEVLDGLMLNQAILNGEMCIPETDLTLTKEGFKSLDEITENDFIGTFNAESGEIEYQKYTAKHVYDFDGEMCLFRTDRIDFACTPNHKMLVQKRDHNDWEIEDAKDIKDRCKFKKQVKWSGENYQDVIINGVSVPIDMYIRLVAYYVTEGYLSKRVRKNKTKEKVISGVCISQSKKGKAYDDVKLLISELSNLFESNSYNSDYHFTLTNKYIANYLLMECGEYSDSKRIPQWMKDVSVDKLHLLLMCMIDGDDTIRTRDRGEDKQYYTYSTKNKDLAYDVMEIALKCGYWPRIRERRNIYEVDFSDYDLDKETLSLESKKYKTVDTLPYKGRIYCFTVPNHFIITMRNGKLMISHNSGYSSAQVGIEVLIRRLDNWRNILKEWVEEKIFLPVAMMQGFFDEEESKELGETVYLYPKLKWNDLQLRDKTQKIQTMLQCNDKGFVSAQSILEELDLDYDTEIEKLRSENIMSSQAGLLTGQNEDMGGGLGGMLGGGGMPPDGGMGGMAGDMAGGMDGGMEGSLGGDMGSGMGGDMAGGGMPASASQQLPVIKKRGEKKKEEEKEYSPPVPIKLTKLEYKMFKVLSSLNIPTELFAQYKIKVPGEQQPFVMDFAYPRLGVGIETDGNVFHERPDFKQRDMQRDQKLAQRGWRVLRFKEEAISENMDAVKNAIVEHLKDAYKQNKKAQEENGNFKKYASLNNLNLIYEDMLISKENIGCYREKTSFGEILYIGRVDNG